MDDGHRRVPDIDRNGLDEFTLSFSGGMHQGQGGVGVNVMQFADGLPQGIGSFKAEEFGPTEAVTVWKVTAKPGKTPVYYKQKYFSGEGRNYRRVGGNQIFKLGEPYGKFAAVK